MVRVSRVSTRLPIDQSAKRKMQAYASPIAQPLWVTDAMEIVVVVNNVLARNKAKLN